MNIIIVQGNSRVLQYDAQFLGFCRCFCPNWSVLLCDYCDASSHATKNISFFSPQVLLQHLFTRRSQNTALMNNGWSQFGKTAHQNKVHATSVAGEYSVSAVPSFLICHRAYPLLRKHTSNSAFLFLKIPDLLGP